MGSATLLEREASSKGGEQVESCVLEPALSKGGWAILILIFICGITASPQPRLQPQPPQPPHALPPPSQPAHSQPLQPQPLQHQPAQPQPLQPQPQQPAREHQPVLEQPAIEQPPAPQQMYPISVPAQHLLDESQEQRVPPWMHPAWSVAQPAPVRYSRQQLVQLEPGVIAIRHTPYPSQPAMYVFTLDQQHDSDDMDASDESVENARRLLRGTDVFQSQVAALRVLVQDPIATPESVSLAWTFIHEHLSAFTDEEREIIGEISQWDIDEISDESGEIESHLMATTVQCVPSRRRRGRRGGRQARARRQRSVRCQQPQPMPQPARSVPQLAPQSATEAEDSADDREERFMQSIMAELGECQLPQSALRAAPEDHWPAWLDPFASAEHSTDTYPWLDQPSTDVLPQQFAQLAPSDPPALASPAELQPAASLDVYEELGLGYSPGGTAHGVYEPLDSMAECEASGDHELGDDESYSPGGTAADGYEPFLTTGMQHSQGHTCSPGGCSPAGYQPYEPESIAWRVHARHEPREPESIAGRVHARHAPAYPVVEDEWTYPEGWHESEDDLICMF